MFTGSADELRRKEQEAADIGEQIAELLNRLEAIAPGSVTAHNGRISGLAISIRRIRDRWSLTQ
ncbi:hypothetical protein [Streptomyces sp. NPDC087525]|uniref:hypothetical protein n=1 Tax=Streptomyces sp. NPDC087525 TaxID=3365793 RepID=UPI00381A47EE